jgi:hypothetical protein
MTTLLPRDDDNAPIPAMTLKAGGAHALAAGAASARTAQAFTAGTRVVSLFATEPVFVALGDSTVTASAADHFFPAGIYYDLSLGHAKGAMASHIAAIRAGAEDATLYISEKA